MSCSVPLMRENSLACFPARSLELFDCKVGVSENANLAGDAHGLHRQILRCKFRMLQQRPGSRQSIRAARSDSHKPIIRLDHVANPLKNECALGVRDDLQRIQMSK